MRFEVVHETLYRYETPVVLSQQLLHLSPRPLPWQERASHAIRVEPEPAESAERVDYFGNPVTQIALAMPHQSLAVRARTEVSLAPRPRPPVAAAWEEVRDRLRAGGGAAPLDAVQFAFESPHVELFRDLSAYGAKSFARGRNLLEAALDLTGRIHAEFAFDPKATSVSTPLREVLQKRRGVCQDFAHLMIGCLRALGLAARYVSGYILTTPPPGRPRLIGADASHAWVSLWCANADALGGWVDLDPTNDCLVDEQHITLAWGRDFGDVTPMRGVILGGGEQELQVHVTVTPQ